jgi:mannonate dehydratase
MENTKHNPERRRFGKQLFAGALGTSFLFTGTGCEKPEKRTASAKTRASSIKLAAQLGSNPTQEDIQLVKQLGIEYVTMGSAGEQATYEGFVKMKAMVEKEGLKVWNIGNRDVHNMEEVTLNLPGRDAKIEAYKQYLRNLSKAGIFYTTYAHMGNGIWSSEREETRGGASARALNLASGEAKGHWNGKVFKGPLTHGRVYTEDEIWDNYDYFIKQVVPVAEEVGVRIGVHPDDPPVPELGGVPRCIFSSFDGYKRALEIADSPNVGICLCVGCWLEGGEGMGKDVLETIRYFGERGKIWKVHFRNVNEPLPHFVETFMDDGYMEMYKVMKALREVNFDGALIADHVPQMVGGRRVGLAYSIGYMKALLERVNAEVG